MITFHGKKVAKGKTVRRIVTKQFSAKYKKQLEAYRKGLRTTTDANRKEKLRRRIIRVRVIKGGMDYIKNLQNRFKRYEKIFKKNKILFDTVKGHDAVFFKEMMGKFTDTKNKLTKE